MSDMELEPGCPVCGSDMFWERCTQVGCDDGWIDLYEDDPLWYDPGDVEACPICDGNAGWLICLDAENHPPEPVSA